MSRFCTALDQGQRCVCRALPGKDLCYGHHLALLGPPTPIRRCAYFSLRGEPCRASAMRGQDHCFVHSPRNQRRKLPATPLQPRTRRQRAYIKALIFSRMPHT